MQAAAAAWDALAAELGSAAGSFGSVTHALVDAAWQGPASAAMTGAGSSGFFNRGDGRAGFFG